MKDPRLMFFLSLFLQPLVCNTLALRKKHAATLLLFASVSSIYMVNKCVSHTVGARLVGI